MKETIKYIAFIWLGMGFAVGCLESLIMRDDRTFVNDKYVDTSKSGCVYQSAISLLNPGHILGCELFRRRFEIEGFGKK